MLQSFEMNERLRLFGRQYPRWGETQPIRQLAQLKNYETLRLLLKPQKNKCLFRNYSKLCLSWDTSCFLQPGLFHLIFTPILDFIAQASHFTPKHLPNLAFPIQTVYLILVSMYLVAARNCPRPPTN